MDNTKTRNFAITEDYVSFETAKLLKEKGFDWCTYAYYEDEDNPNISLHASKAINWNKTTEFISKPTLQMAMKWLRETFEIHCQIDCPIVTFNWRYGIRNLNQDEWFTLRDMGDYETYEEAAEAAIEYCLENLI